MGTGARHLFLFLFNKLNQRLETEPPPRRRPFLSILLFVPLLTIPSTGVPAAIIIVLFLLYGSALISGSEVAFFSLTHNDFARLREEKSKPAARIMALQETPRTLLATILISNNFINIAIVLVSDYILRNILPVSTMVGWSQGLKSTLPFITFPDLQLAGFINFLITVLGVTFLLVLFGEVAPKIYSKINNVQMAKFMSGPIMVLMNLFRPFSRLMVKGTNYIETRLERKRAVGNITSKAEIDEAIELTVRHESNTRQEIDILKSIVKFGDVSVKQIMRSRVDVVAADTETSYDELLEIVQESGYSRIPVYEESFDNVKGILYAKDLLAHLNEPPDFEWQKLLRTHLIFIPESKKINEMLKIFQSERMHMAVVVDEFGGTSGIVTLEDILEEVIGEIKDEFDDEIELEYEKLDEWNFIFEGKTLLNDVCRIIKIDTAFFDELRGDADSLAGLVLQLSGQIPKKGAEYTYQGFRFKIISASKKRIEQIKVTLPD